MMRRKKVVISHGRRVLEEGKDSSLRVEVILREEGVKTAENQLKVEQDTLKRQAFTHPGRPKREQLLPWHNFKGRRLNLGQKEKPREPILKSPKNWSQCTHLGQQSRVKNLQFSHFK